VSATPLKKSSTEPRWGKMSAQMKVKKIAQVKNPAVTTFFSELRPFPPENPLKCRTPGSEWPRGSPSCDHLSRQDSAIFNPRTPLFLGVAVYSRTFWKNALFFPESRQKTPNASLFRPLDGDFFPARWPFCYFAHRSQAAPFPCTLHQLYKNPPKK